MKVCTKNLTVRRGGSKSIWLGFEWPKMEIMGIEPMTSCKFPDLRLVQSMRATAAPYPPEAMLLAEFKIDLYTHALPQPKFTTQMPMNFDADDTR
jgi:hypothetical protein